MRNLKSVGLSLDGGAAKGWAHTGMILALVDKKYPNYSYSRYQYRCLQELVRERLLPKLFVINRK